MRVNKGVFNARFRGPGRSRTNNGMSTETHSRLTNWPASAASETDSRGRPAFRYPHVPIAIKLAIVITALAVGGMAALGLFLSGQQDQVMREQLHDFGGTVAAQLAQLAGEPILSEDSLALRMLAGNLVQDEKILGAAVYSRDGRRLSEAGLQLPASIDQDLFASGQGYRSWSNPDDPAERLVSFTARAEYRDLHVGNAVVTLSASLMDEAGARARRVIAYATVAMSLLASILAWFMSRRLSQPIHNIMKVTRAIDGGDFAMRIQDRRNDEIGFLIEGINNMAEGLLRKSQVERVFSRYVSKNVAAKVLANLDEVRLGSRHVEATVLFADIVGFTAMAEELEPGEVSELLNEYFSYISTACRLHDGVVDKFIGDCAMLVFGGVDEDRDHAFNAVCCALLIQRMAGALNEMRRRRGRPEIQFRIGINSGMMLAGNLGSDERMEYTVVGDSVNMASRLCYVAGAGQVIIREELYKQLEGDSRLLASAQQTLPIRGKSRPVTVYNVYDVHSRYRPMLRARLDEVLGSRGGRCA